MKKQLAERRKMGKQLVAKLVMAERIERKKQLAENNIRSWMRTKTGPSDTYGAEWQDTRQRGKVGAERFCRQVEGEGRAWDNAKQETINEQIEIA